MPATTTLPNDAAGYIGRVPVRNLWLLMLYASDLFGMQGIADIGLEDSPHDLPDLLAILLHRAVSNRLRRQLNSGYRTNTAVLNRVRGRIDILNTERHQLLMRGLVRCRFDQLSIDTPRNRFVRAALEAIAAMGVRKKNAQNCLALAAELRGIGVVGKIPSYSERSMDRFGQHDLEDRFMVAAAKLVFDLALLTEDTGLNTLAQPEREAAWVRNLFERAVSGFYTVMLGAQGWKVQHGHKLFWQIANKTHGIAKILPNMKTDIILDHEEKQTRIIIDTKFASIIRKGWHREKTLDSGYIYQMYAYLRSQVGGSDPLADRASGLLLHPAIDEMIEETILVQGHHIRFGTVNLAAPSSTIRTQLMQVIEINKIDI